MILDSQIFERVLVIEPHSDDSILGAGGLMTRVLAEVPNAHIHVVTATIGSSYSCSLDRVVTAEERAQEIKDSLNYISEYGISRRSYGNAKGLITQEILTYDKDGILSTVPEKDMVSKLDKIIQEFDPTTVLLCDQSVHQDHCYINRIGIAALRPSCYNNIKLKLLYEYPLLSLNPNRVDTTSRIYIDISKYINAKIRAFKCHKSQVNREKRDLLHPNNVKLLARYRGMENFTEYAEAYRLINMSL